MAAPPPLAPSIKIPKLSQAPIIDGNLDDWKSQAFTDGLWDMERVRTTPWYQSKKNRLTDHGDEPSETEDLNARYYMAWDAQFLYLGADVTDNKNDVSESKHAPKRWYYKDAIAWFIEAPRDTLTEVFQQGNHGFAFVIDTTRPDYGVWWRHGDAETQFIEEALPAEAYEFALKMTPKGYLLEAKIDMTQTFKPGDPAWKSPQEGDEYGLMIVHCDPDGGEYGGHMLIYGKNDTDKTWSTVVLSGEKQIPERKVK